MTLSENKRRPIIIGPNIPELPLETDVWLNIANNTLYRYDGSVWNIISSASAVSGSAGYTFEQIQDAVAPLLDHASHTNLTASYDDAGNKILLVVPSESIQDAAASLLTHSNHTNITASYNDSFNRVELTNTALDPTTASATYLTQANASATYLTQSNASSNYLTQSNASSTYLTQANASSTYLTQAAGLTAASASATYLTQTNASATYIRQSNQQSIINSASAAAVNYLVGTAPSTLDTLQELAVAVNNDPNFTVSVANGIANKLDTSTYASASPSFLSQVSASSIYLTQSSASTTYIPQTSPVTSYKNKLINGSFNIWQRGTSFSNLGTTSANAYTADRWQGYRNNADSGLSVTRQASGLTGFEFCTRVQRISGNNKVNQLFLLQMMESSNSIPLAGKTITLSFWARAGANFSASSNILAANILTGTGTDQSAWTNGENLPGNPNTPPNLTGGVIPISQNFNITTSWVRYSVTGTLASNITQIGIRFHYLPSGTAGTDDFVEIAGVQLEEGSIATTLEQRFIGNELALCQRYYERGFFWYEGPVNGGSQNVRNIQYIVQKRTGVFPGASEYGAVSGANSNITSHAPESGYDVYNTLYPQSNSNTGFNWRFVATSTGNCTIRQWWAANAEL